MTASMCQSGKCHRPLNRKERLHAGYDNRPPLAETCSRCTVSEHGKVVLRKQLRRDQVAAFFGNLPPCLVGMEACASAHHWARKLQALGHTVRSMAPQFVKPYVKSNKNDAADAEAICEAVARPSMRFVPIKNVEQQSVLALHRVRQGFVKAVTARKRTRFAVCSVSTGSSCRRVSPTSPSAYRTSSRMRRSSCPAVSAIDRSASRASQAASAAGRRDRGADQGLASDQRCEPALEKVPGIGPLTATALVASVGDAKNFDNARQFAVRLGLVPRQHSSGGKPTLLGMSKRGDAYLRTMLIHGARAVIYRAMQRADVASWLVKLTNRRNKNIAAVALANKTARTVGHYWRTTGSSRPDTPRSRPRLSTRTAHHPNDSNKEIPTADCSGDQQVDGTTGQTVVGTSRARRGTQSACKRSRCRPAEPIRDSELVSHQKSGCTGAISSFVQQ